MQIRGYGARTFPDCAALHPGYSTLSPQCAQPGIEFLDAFEQVERECGTGNIDPKVALQVQRDACAPQAAGGETPVTPASAAGLQYALLYQGLDEFGLDGTGAAQFDQCESRLLVD